MAVYPCSIYRTLYDSSSSMEYCGYLQCADGIPEPDRTSCIERSDCQRDKRYSMQNITDLIRKRIDRIICEFEK